jgi:hypothetical protein
MSGIAIVLSFERKNDEDGHGINVNLDPGGEPFTADHFGVPGIDAPPMRDDSAALVESHGAGQEQAVGYEDTKNAGQAQAGEIRIYARDANGAPMCTVFIRNDGRIQMSNANGSIELAADGPVNINGLVIDVDGNVTTPGQISADGEVTAMAVSPATSVTLSQHIHPTGVGPSSPATPGT